MFVDPHKHADLASLVLVARDLSPLSAHNRLCQPVIETPCNDVEGVLEQVRLRVQRHRRRRSPEHPLHRLHLRASAHRQARRSVPKPVRVVDRK
jgi:hypothetical protein